MEFINDIKARIPDYAKDIRLNLDGVIARSSLDPKEAVGAALAAAFAAKSSEIVAIIRGSGELDAAETAGALSAAALMGMTNAWYTYTDMAAAADAELPKQQAQLRMNAYANHGGVGARKFETWALAASVVGKCRFCVASHADVLKKEGMSTTQLRDIGRIAAVINAAAQVIAAESPVVEALAA